MPVGPAGLPLRPPVPGGPHLSAASRMFIHRLLGLHLRYSLSRFDPMAHVAPSGLYKQPPAPLPGAIPETLIHIFLMRIRASYQDKISPP
jgi:hypothetical protein